MNFLNRNAGAVALIAVVIAIGGYFYPQIGQGFGAILDTSYFDYFQASTSGGFQVGSNTVINGSRAATFTGLTLSSAATSTASMGCIQTNATSSATTIKLIPSITGATSTFSGTVYWAYGTCP